MNTSDIIDYLASAAISAEDGTLILRAVRGAMARAEGRTLVCGRGVRILPPDGGYVMEEQWATGSSSATWYPTLDAARAALAALADGEDRCPILHPEPNSSGCLGFVDLTVPGCVRSDAAIWTRDAWVARQGDLRDAA